MRRTFIISLLVFCLSFRSEGQSRIVEDFSPICDSLASLISERSGVEGELKLKAVMRRKNSLDFYFNEYLGDFPWNKDDIRWFRSTLKELFPENYQRYRLGEIYSRRVDLNRLAMPSLTYDGNPAENRHKVKKPSSDRLIVNRIGRQTISKGLAGRHIALWQSHGRYFDQGSEEWIWQRPCLFQTCEDMFTQGFVLPYLVPMLENAGAYVLLPRERDVQRHEIIADNDPSCGARGFSEYQETGRWSDAGEGFADIKPILEDLENPFRNGTARQALCVSSSTKPTSSIKWTPEIPEKGEYAVYVSYKTLPNSSSAAHYTVTHRGGRTEFAVDQRMGGGTWIYLGTFEFDKGTEGYVTLDNTTPKGYRMGVGATVTADAVRFGGGMGNIARSRWISPEDSLTVELEPCTSGLPRSAEAARYWLQWAGTDTTVYYQNGGQNDYKDDFMSRGDWVEWISRGSRINPDGCGGLGIPVDLSLGFHSDAGVTPNDSLIGTLAIYTYKSEGKTSLPSGEDRLTSRMFADIVQSQIVDDLRSEHDTLWPRRSIWDRAYRESRTPSCPAMLLELLSHQNFADMKHGLDPSFRFSVSRAVYKGMLKYLSNRYGCDYAVQPLPVNHIGVEFETGNTVSISWKPVSDPLEPTAVPSGYIIYRRIGNGSFDSGTLVDELSHDSDGFVRYRTDIPRGEVVSFKVAAFNEGGTGFPSETVSIGIPSNTLTDNMVLIVNNFDRISAPAWFDGEDRAGFDPRQDSGVGYMREITHVGEMYDFRRSNQWLSNERPGFGASYTDMAGNVVAGNSFDYPAIHGKAVLSGGMAFYSCSNERFISDQDIRTDAWTIDLICGKQVTVPTKMGNKYAVFPEGMQRAIKEFTSTGGNVLISGAYIGTDAYDNIYPIDICDTTKKQTIKFINNTLGYKYITGNASRHGKVIPWKRSIIKCPEDMNLTMSFNEDIYCIESADGISPASESGHVILKYTDSGISAGVAYQGDGYRCVSLGFPIETLQCPESIDNLIINILDYFKK